MSDARLKRNMVQRRDGRLVNAGMKRGMLFVCATGCCCGRTDRGYQAVPTDLYHQEWERRKLRNTVHLNQGGCLGPCPLANVSMLLLDGRAYWFHSLDDGPLIVALYDYLEAMLAAGRHLPPLPALAPHVFNGFAWDGSQGAGDRGQGPESEFRSLAPAPQALIVLSQADTDLLALHQARAQLPADFAPLHLAHVGRVEDDVAVDLLLDKLLPMPRWCSAGSIAPARFAMAWSGCAPGPRRRAASCSASPLSKRSTPISWPARRSACPWPTWSTPTSNAAGRPTWPAA